MNSTLKYFGYFKVNFLVDILAELGGFLLGVILAFFVKARIEEESLVLLGSMLAAIVLVVVCMFDGMVLYYQKFNVAVAMGCTRKKFLEQYFLTSAVFMGIDVLVLYLLNQIEKSLYASVFPAKELEGMIDWLFRPRIILLFILAGVVVKFFTGMVVLRFGKIGFFAMWGVYMVGCLSLSRIGEMVAKHPDGKLAGFIYEVIRIANGMNGMGGYILGYAILAVVLLVFVRMAMKQEVRSS